MTRTEQLSEWAQAVDAIHTRRESDEAKEIANAIEKVLAPDALAVGYLRDQLVVFLLELREKGGEKPHATTRGLHDDAKKVRRALAAIQGAPEVLGRLHPEFKEAARLLDSAERAFTDRASRLTDPNARKVFVENHVAFLLSKHGVRLSTFEKSALAEVLRIAYSALSMNAGSHLQRVLHRLCKEYDFKAEIFPDVEEHERVEAFVEAVLALPLTHDAGTLEKQALALHQASEASEASPSMCVSSVQAAMRR